MNRVSVIVAVSAALSISAVALVVWQLGSGPIHGPPGGDGAIARVEDELGALETSAQELERRLGALERRLAAVDRPGGVPEGEATDDDEPIAEAADGEDESDPDHEALFARVDSLERRVSSLEEDPVQRGYYYIESESPELRRQGILALERVAQNDPEARDAIRGMLTDPDAGVRLTALDTLADIEDKDAIPAMYALLEDPEGSVRAEAVNTLGRLGASEAAPAIAGLLADGDARVRERAADQLGRLKYEGAGDILVKALADENERVRREAISSLGEIGAGAAIAPLRKLYEAQPGGDRVRIALALKRLGEGGPYSVELARLSRTALEDENENARRDAVRTLIWYMRDDARDVLQKALEDPSRRIRSEVQQALRSRGRR